MIARLRRNLHILVAEVLYASGLLRLWFSLRRGLDRRTSVFVLGLHRVLSPSQRARANSLAAIVLSESVFSEMLDYLRGRFDILSLEQFLAAQGNGRGRPSCLLTFDDGWGDNFTTAFPALHQRAMPATILVTTGMVGTRDGFWVEQLIGLWKSPSGPERVRTQLARAPARVAGLEEAIELLKRLPARQRESLLGRIFTNHEPRSTSAEAAATTDAVDRMLTWEEILRMSREGIDFGGHTATHPLLPFEDPATVVEELSRSKQLLEEQLRTRIVAFAYPNGDWDQATRHRVKQAGYRCAFTTSPGWYRPGQDPFTISRILLHDGCVTGRDGRFSPAMFEFTLAGWH